MFLMSEGPSFEADRRCEVDVLCLSWCAQLSGIKRVVWPEKSPSQRDSKSLLGPCPEKEIFGKPFGTSSNSQCCLCVLVCDSSLIFFPVSLIFEVFDVNTVLALAGLCLLTLLVGNSPFFPGHCSPAFSQYPGVQFPCLWNRIPESFRLEKASKVTKSSL